MAGFDRLGAHAAAARARADMRAHGWAAPRAARTSTREHPAGLTARESEVLDLLERGCTDAAIAERLVISRRTAEHHVASILTKLGASSRRELLNIGGVPAKRWVATTHDRAAHHRDAGGVQFTRERITSMPLFMDIHSLGDGVTMDAVAQAHQADLATQGPHDVSYLRYWVDEDRGQIFCLVEAPTPRPPTPCIVTRTVSWRTRSTR